jgi:hypothetical protein
MTTGPKISGTDYTAEGFYTTRVNHYRSARQSLRDIGALSCVQPIQGDEFGR